MAEVRWFQADPQSCYETVRVLGQGYYGTVFQCVHRVTGEDMAMKVQQKSHPDYSHEEVVNEVNVLRAVCDHPNIATLFEVYETAEQVYLVQEPCLGGELFDYIIDHKHVTESLARRTASVLLSIVQHCHSRGVLHRDLKPENFLLKWPVQPDKQFDPTSLRAVDFGLSVFFGPEGCDEVVGSPSYTAPEMLKGLSYGPPADLWSLGVVLFILVGGYPPFYGENDEAIYRRIQYEEPDMDDMPWNDGSVTGLACDFAKRLLHKDPAQRMTAAQAQAHPWLTAKQSAVQETPLPADIFRRLENFTRQNRLKCLLMTVVAHNVADSAISKLRRAFHEMDTDRDGFIGMADITAALRHVDVNLEAHLPELKNMVTALDLGGAHHGRVCVDEFLAAALDQKAVLTRSTLTSVFQKLDSDGDGVLSVKELAGALAESGVAVPAGALQEMMQGQVHRQGLVTCQSFQNLLMAGDYRAASPGLGQMGGAFRSSSPSLAQMGGAFRSSSPSLAQMGGDYRSYSPSLAQMAGEYRSYSPSLPPLPPHMAGDYRSLSPSLAQQLESLSVSSNSVPPPPEPSIIDAAAEAAAAASEGAGSERVQPAIKRVDSQAVLGRNRLDEVLRQYSSSGLRATSRRGLAAAPTKAPAAGDPSAEAAGAAPEALAPPQAAVSSG